MDRMLIAVWATANVTPIFEAKVGKVGAVILKKAPIVILATYFWSFNIL